jgi:hypothetical protein
MEKPMFFVHTTKYWGIFPTRQNRKIRRWERVIILHKGLDDGYCIPGFPPGTCQMTVENPLSPYPEEEQLKWLKVIGPCPKNKRAVIMCGPSGQHYTVSEDSSGSYVSCDYRDSCLV